MEKKMKLVTILVGMNLLCISLPSFSYKYSPDDLRQFKESNSCVGCNLSNISLFENHQNANLTGANVSSTDLYGDYTKANFSNINGIHLSLLNASGASFVNATLIEARFRNSNLTDTDFTNANVNSADFSYANLYGSKITQLQLLSAKTLCNAILPDGTKVICNSV